MTFILALVALAVVLGIRVTITASHRLDAILADALADIDVARWEEEQTK